MGRSYLSNTKTPLTFLTMTLGVAGSVLAHGFFLSLPMPRQVTLKPEPSPTAQELVQVSLRPSSELKRFPRPATVNRSPEQKQVPKQRVERPRQIPAIAPIAAAKPAPLPLPEPQPLVSPSPQHVPPSPEASPSFERSQQPNSPAQEQQPALFSDFPQADQASLCGSEHGDCWRVADTRWNFVRDNLEMKLQAKGQVMNEVDRDDDPAFRVYGVYENGKLKSFVHMLSLDQSVTYILCDEELSKEAVLARVTVGKSDNGLPQG